MENLKILNSHGQLPSSGGICNHHDASVYSNNYHVSKENKKRNKRKNHCVIEFLVGRHSKFHLSMNRFSLYQP